MPTSWLSTLFLAVLLMTDTQKASWITDHAFEPRIDRVAYGRNVPGKTTQRWDRAFPPTPYLCQQCRMAEAAHRDTTIERNP